MGWTVEELAKLTGYSKAAVYMFERGVMPPLNGVFDRPIKPKAWLRYKMACLGVAAQHNAKKQWRWN